MFNGFLFYLECNVSVGNDCFDSSQHKVCYGKVKLGPMLYQDNAMRLTTTLEGAQDGSHRFQKVMESKMLDINVDKSIYLLIGKKKTVQLIRDDAL